MNPTIQPPKATPITDKKSHNATSPPPTLWQGLARIGNCQTTLLLLVLSLVFSMPVRAQQASANFCSRTQQVKEAILDRIPGITECANVTDAHLASITSLSLDSKSISSLQNGDFDGLSALTTLYLSSNALTTLDADIFDGLSALTTLDLSSNQLTTLDADIFDGLSALTTLNLYGNELTTLDADIFDGLSALTTLYLYLNDLTTLDADIFDGLSALTTLYLYLNRLTTLDADIFDGLSALTGLDLSNNQLTTLDAGIFDGLSALITLSLHANQFSTLPAGVFDGLSALTELELSRNQLTTLDAGIFDGLSALTDLGLWGNPLPTSLPGSLFADVPRSAIRLPAGTTVDYIPTTVGTIADITDFVAMSSPQTVDVADKFSDAGDVLTFTAISGDTNIATVTLIGSEVTVTPVAEGMATITVTATDMAGQTAEQTFSVTVQADDITTGTAGVKKIDASVSPNPLKDGDSVTITVASEGVYHLFGSSGEFLTKGTLTKGDNAVAFPFLAKGMYLLKIQTTHGRVTRKVVKN